MTAALLAVLGILIAATAAIAASEWARGRGR